MSILGDIFGLVTNPVGTVVDAAGNLLGSLGKTSAANQSAQVNGQEQLSKDSLQQQEGEQSMSNDAWKKLMQSQYMMNRPTYTPAISKAAGTAQYGESMPNFGTATRTTTPAMLQGATDLSNSSLARLANPGAGVIPLPGVSSLSPNGFQQFTNFAAPALTFLGKAGPSLNTIFNGPNGAPTSTTPAFGTDEDAQD